MMTGKCGIHGTDLSTTGICWCEVDKHKPPGGWPTAGPAPVGTIAAMPCPECARLKSALSDWQGRYESSHASRLNAEKALHAVMKERDKAASVLAKANAWIAEAKETLERAGKERDALRAKCAESFRAGLLRAEAICREIQEAEKQPRFSAVARGCASAIENERNDNG